MSLASPEIPHIIWNPKVHYRTHKRQPPLPTQARTIQFMHPHLSPCRYTMLQKVVSFDVRNFTTLHNRYEFHVNARFELSYEKNYPHFTIEVSEENKWPLRN